MKPRADIVQLLLGFCQTYDKQMTEPLLSMWNSVLCDLTPDELIQASKEFLRGPNCAWMPKPGQIYQIARPPVDYETEATLIAEEVIKLLGPCGPEAGERALSKLSEKGRAYIELVGGWYKFSTDMQHSSEDDLPIIKAQMRKAIKGIVQRRTNASLALEQKATLKSLGVEMKSLPEEKE